MMRHMFLLKRHRLSLSHLMIALFVVQLLATSFCVMQAHATSMVNTVGYQSEHCTNMAQEKNNHYDQRSACTHCDQPDELRQVHQDTTNIVYHAISDVIWLNIPAPYNHSIPSRLFFPTGPPKSSTLLYTTTQRIRL